MKTKLKYWIISSILFAILTATSCSDVWDNHYYSDSAQNKSELNLYEYIKSQPELTTFSKMLDISGYDSILNKPITYTVWAPTNSALTSINLTDKESVTDLVKNHISRFSYPTSKITSNVIYMLDKKFVLFQRTDNGYSFGGKNVLLDKSNTATSNGILHVIDGFVAYNSNIWEYIGKTPGLDSLRNYLYSQSEYQFDPKTSVEIGTNEHGQSIYDSVIIFTNPILSKIGSLHLEDSVYTALLPNNTAWTKAYNLIKNKYKTLGADGAKQQRLNTQLAIVKNIVFKKSVPDPSLFDSLISTSGNVFKLPSYLFVNATKKELSNGYAYVTDSLRFKAEDSYQQKVQIEAENSSYGRSSLYANLFIRSSLGSTLDSGVSQSKFLVVEPTTVAFTTQNSVTFPIPNTLSGKYNIYCVFIPSSIANVNDARSYKFSFYFSYMGANGTQVNDATIDSKNNVVVKAGAISATFSTKPNVISKVFVTQFTFPYCNLFNTGDATSTITTKLRVENASKITESVLFDRSLRIDYVVLEPAQ